MEFKRVLSHADFSLLKRSKPKNNQSLIKLSTDILLTISTFLSQYDFFVLCNTSLELNYLLNFPYKWFTLYINLNRPIELYIYLFQRYIHVCEDLVFYGKYNQDLLPFYHLLLSTINHIHQIKIKSTPLFLLPIPKNVNVISLEFPSEYSIFCGHGLFGNHCVYMDDCIIQSYSFYPYIDYFKYSFWQCQFYVSVKQSQDIRLAFFINAIKIGQIILYATQTNHYYHVNDIIRLPKKFYHYPTYTLQLSIQCMTDLHQSEGYIAMPLEGRVTFLKHAKQILDISSSYPQFHCYKECTFCDL